MALMEVGLQYFTALVSENDKETVTDFVILIFTRKMIHFIYQQSRRKLPVNSLTKLSLSIPIRSYLRGADKSIVDFKHL